jgi:peptidyl-tRNA hydrolase
MANTRLTCVIRKGLGLPEGLLAAQAAHISDQWMRDKIIKGEQFTEEELDWMKTPYISILAVNTLEELNVVYTESQRVGLNPTPWRDTVYSNLLNQKLPDMFVGFSVGPADADKISEVTSKLPLY